MYVLQSNEAIVKINSLCKCIYGAKTVLMFAYDSAQDWKNPEESGIHSSQQDVSIVATHAMLEACNLGIASCWVNLFSNSKVAEAFNLPENERVVLLMPLGYAAETSKPHPKWHYERKEIVKTVKYL